MSHAAALLALTNRQHRVRSAARRLLHIEPDARRAVNIARGNATQGEPEFWQDVIRWIESHPIEKGHAA